MDYTSNYRLKLPAKTDVIDITVLNSNFSAVDAKLAALENKVDTVQLSDTLGIISASGSISFYHGTSTALKIDTTLLPPNITLVQREEYRNKFIDKVFITNSVKSATMYAKKACQKYGGKPVVYQVKPIGYINNINNAEFICESATILQRRNI